MVNHINLFSIMLCASLALSGCSTNKVQQGTIPEQGLTVSQLYKNQAQPALPERYVKRVVTKASKTKRSKFKVLANPEIPIHVFAHVANLGNEQIIKPGYSTRFFLYKQNQYALASELY